MEIEGFKNNVKCDQVVVDCNNDLLILESIQSVSVILHLLPGGTLKFSSKGDSTLLCLSFLMQKKPYKW